MNASRAPRHLRGKHRCDPPGTRVKLGALFGLFASLIGLLAGAMRMGLAHAIGARLPIASRHTTLIIPVYILAFVIPGGLLGLLWPLGKWWVGRAALAFLFGFLFFIGPMSWRDGSPLHWTGQTFVVYAGAGVLLGLMMWYAFTHSDAPRA